MRTLVSIAITLAALTGCGPAPYGAGEEAHDREICGYVEPIPGQDGAPIDVWLANTSAEHPFYKDWIPGVFTQVWPDEDFCHTTRFPFAYYEPGKLNGRFHLDGEPASEWHYLSQQEDNGYRTIVHDLTIDGELQSTEFAPNDKNDGGVDDAFVYSPLDE